MYIAPNICIKGSDHSKSVYFFRGKKMCVFFIYFLQRSLQALHTQSVDRRCNVGLLQTLLPALCLYHCMGFQLEKVSMDYECTNCSTVEDWTCSLFIRSQFSVNKRQPCQFKIDHACGGEELPACC